ncbi:hypothetical protein EYF80_028105 [Liparis tanakae]|uniref:Uncharacterized protein n=1 Tax=Liparis tanakae TaxID=230148 RepID=A0A4Z2H8U0_9TELE|nr:hypothetical protein EYF80_028105 [Liparis tanakae]
MRYMGDGLVVDACRPAAGLPRRLADRLVERPLEAAAGVEVAEAMLVSAAGPDIVQSLLCPWIVIVCMEEDLPLGSFLLPWPC